MEKAILPNSVVTDCEQSNIRYAVSKSRYRRKMKSMADDLREFLYKHREALHVAGDADEEYFDGLVACVDAALKQTDKSRDNAGDINQWYRSEKRRGQLKRMSNALFRFTEKHREVLSQIGWGNEWPDENISDVAGMVAVILDRTEAKEA